MRGLRAIARHEGVNMLITWVICMATAEAYSALTGGFAFNKTLIWLWVAYCGSVTILVDLVRTRRRRRREMLDRFGPMPPGVYASEAEYFADAAAGWPTYRAWAVRCLDGAGRANGPG